ncbi:MAG TPA: MiaB/RimO family radical SAM methylthiotransferase [Candidatus Dormibacteraeota bacterium]|jgi:tRNA-2-methylthio-N6-dimethylallyladenosine synthase|nr:MiaB/RimO family radical SAM methylthiotransferase [Candidatus Dormibacteraeota bacterium]
MSSTPTKAFHIWTIGCQMNVADSESLALRLLQAGYVEADLDRADIAILNTCCVRQGSEDKVHSKLGELRSWKQPGRTLALTGCLGVKDGEALQQRFPQLDHVIPIGDYDSFLAELGLAYDWSQGEAQPPAGRIGISHFVPIIEGCDHNCTFCIVPTVRGREKHVPSTTVVARCASAVAAGASEIVLLGQNVDDYQDPNGAGGLASLVRAVERIPGLKRLRFMTSHPQDLEPELLEAMAASEVICHELQLPIQSGDDQVLKRMARGYQVRHYRAIIQRARELMPEIGLVTDIIVGFPGETEAAFQNTRALMEEIEFDVVHLAQYSPRPGTFSADRMVDDVPAAEKRRRINDLLTLQRGIAGRRTQRWVGKTVEVLVEGRDELNRSYGRTRQGKRVVVQASHPRAGDMIEVMVDSASAGQLVGRAAGRGLRVLSPTA